MTDRDQVCLGWEGRDLPKLRCMDVVEIDGVLHKYKTDGSLSGRIIDFADGNHQCFIQHAQSLEVLDQRGRSLVHILTL